jgi:hypothetical protein
MRKDESQTESAEARVESAPEAVGMADETPAAEALAAPAPAPAAAPGPQGASPKKLGPIGRLMALPEPQRTQGLEQAVASGQTTMLRSLTGKELLVKHGEHVLVVPPAPKPFTAGHAIHILWYHADQVEEQEG